MKQTKRNSLSLPVAILIILAALLMAIHPSGLGHRAGAEGEEQAAMAEEKRLDAENQQAVPETASFLPEEMGEPFPCL